MQRLHLVQATDGVFEAEVGGHTVEIHPPLFRSISSGWAVFVDGFAIIDDVFPTKAAAVQAAEAFVDLVEV